MNKTLEYNHAPVLELTRGALVESVHYGSVAVVNSNGDLIAYYGDPYNVSFMRSSAKPLQALAFIEREGHKRFAFSPKQIALMCASHSGTESHVAEVRNMLQKIDAGEKDLLCGAHPPIHEPTMIAMKCRGEESTPIHNNCSGKHAGMLALAQLIGATFKDYIQPDHPVQRLILKTISEMAKIKAEDIALGIDGCSVPTFAMPLYNAAYAFANLCDPNHLPESRAQACYTITDAMYNHPNMVGGPDRFDTNFMLASPEKAVSKMGAEGYMCLGLPPNEQKNRPNGIGIAIKIADGDSKGRARPVVALETLRQLGWLSEETQAKISKYGPETDILNRRNLIIGKMRPSFTLIHQSPPAEQ